MPSKSPSLYDLKKTTIWFAIASILLMAGLVAMILQDSTREWKDWQRRFIRYQREKTEEKLALARQEVDRQKLEALRTDLEAANQKIAAHHDEIANLERAIDRLDAERVKVDMAYQERKQHQDSDRYFLEEARAHGKEDEIAYYEKRMQSREKEILALKMRLEDLDAALEEKRAQLEDWTEGKKSLEKEIRHLTQRIVLLEKKLKKLEPSLAKTILDAPMLDFLQPTLRIQQIVVENLYDDYYFSKPQKVDRCVTCHLAIDQKGYEEAPVPFRTHPRLDLFLSPDSPHPMEEFGCTVCHGGSGHSLSFVTAAHTPRDKAQAAEWKQKYNWHPLKHWKEKMLPMNHIEASCAKCHREAFYVPEAPKLNEGRRLARTFGCTGCHEIKGFQDFGKVGPSLLHVQSKLQQDWIIRWLQDPKEFRPSTRMPRIFHLENTSDPESREKNNVMIAGIATYLMENSEPRSLETPPLKGDPEIGKRLVEELGCLGCHTVGSLAANDFGPELTGLGSKVKPDWLFTWLKDPQHYAAGTRMPNLRLSDEEAAHITSFLLENRNEKFESLQLPFVKPEVVDELALSFMTGKMRYEDAKDELEKMTPDQKLEFIGQKAIAHQGCFGCHEIKGFETAKRIGTELTKEGSKEIERLDFGFVPIDHTREAWFFQKLKHPRSFDRNRERTYLEKLKMPQFDFTDEEASALVTFLLSLVKTEIPLEMQRLLSDREKEIERGRHLVAKFNCQGCHTLDGMEGRVRTLMDDLGNAPPILAGEGRKVQSRWLYHFIKAPTVIRPWLTYRMPTFPFSDSELRTLVQYFNHLDGVPPSFSDEMPKASSEELSAGRELFEKLQCIKCHQSNPNPNLSSSFLAPDLVMAKDRLRPAWVIDWLRDPQAIQPGTMMPGFFPEGMSPLPDILEGDTQRQIKAIRDYLWEFTAEEAARLMSPKST